MRFPVGLATGLVLWAVAMGVAGEAVAADGQGEGAWQVRVEVARPPRRGRPQKPAVGHLWLPERQGPVRGLIVAGKTLLERRICTDRAVREAAGEAGLGVLYFEPALDAVFDYVHRDSPGKLAQALEELARKTDRPELRDAPLLTIGHSTGGIFARNVAYWRPGRVIGVIHVKSGNFQDGLWDPNRSLAGVPLLAINGEFEEYGPKGGDLKGGLRRRFSLDPNDPRRRNQTQWVMIRMQMLERRRKNPQNLMSLVVHRAGDHTSWDADLSALCAQFIRSAASARLPERAGAGAPGACRPIDVRTGWLSDADIKDPSHEPAPWASYTGDRNRAFWHVDEAMARAVWRYHRRPWDSPDPTAGLDPNERYTPPPILRDNVDGPATVPKE